MTTSSLFACEPSLSSRETLRGAPLARGRDAALPLVSVVAIAYHNADVVLATLESVRRQDYPNIELIVSDDGSRDDTPGVVARWLKQHGERFNGTQLLTSNANEGICRNVAKGIAASRGIWIKAIACDDILCDDAISKFVEQTELDNSELAFAQITKFRAEDGQLQVQGNLLTSEQEIALLKQPGELLKVIRRENFLPAPSAFYSRRLFDAVGGIDTNFKHLDDWPLWLRMLPLVQQVSWIDKPLVLYRMSASSVSQKKKSNPIGALLYTDRVRLYEQMQRPQLGALDGWHMYLQMLRNRLTFEALGNTWPAHRLLMSLQFLSPLTWAAMASSIWQKLVQASDNAMPLIRGAYYFGLPGFRRRVRVFGPITMGIPRSRVSVGHRVVIYEGATLIGKKGHGDTIVIGSFSTLEKNCYLNAHGGKIVLGEHVHVGVGCVLQGYGGLEVGENTMFGPYAQVYTSNHRTSTPPLPRHLLGEKPRAVNIGSNCWVGANCIILPGVRIPAESMLPASTIMRRETELPLA